MKLRLLSLSLTLILLLSILIPVSAVAVDPEPPEEGTESVSNVPTAVLEGEDSADYPCSGGRSCPGRRFTDMPAAGSWAHDAIDWAVRNEVTNGVTKNRFGVNSQCTRAQVVTFLWRVAGCPNPESSQNPYRDVSEKDYYYQAVLWASENGVTTGKTEDSFAPEERCTRAQVVTFLWRRMGQPETEGGNPFQDISRGSYYYKAVLWAVHRGITAGTTSTTFKPGGACTRAQIVTFLYRNFEPSSTVRLPILSYHNLSEEPSDSSMTVSTMVFREQMETIRELGYTPVSLQAVCDYVNKGTPLPEKPVLITFDDGYLSNYTLAYPILQEFGYPAVIYVIGVSIGKDTYKNTGIPIEPHFNLWQMWEMAASDLITIASHGYNVHEVQGLDPDPIRKGVLRKSEESEEEYRAILKLDAKNMFSILGEDARFFAYPYGLHDAASLKILKEAGICTTMILDCKTVNTVCRGSAQSLYDLDRFLVYEDTDRETLRSLLGG